MKLVSHMTAEQHTDLYGIPYDLYYKLKAAVDFIDGNYNKNLSLEEMAQKVFLNPSYFLCLFKKCFKMTPNVYLSTKRLNEACRLLARTNMSIREIAESTGFCNQFYFPRCLKGISIKRRWNTGTKGFHRNGYLETLPELSPPIKAFTSLKVAWLKSPSMECFRQDAAAANSTAAPGLYPSSSA